MGFLDSVGKIAGSAMNSMQEKMERIERYKERYDSLSDEELFRKMKSSSGDAKMACIALLKERGYGNQ